MNYNYEGSVAQRFMQFRTSVLKTSPAGVDIFNTISVYVNSNQAVELVDGYEEGTVTKTSAPVVKTVTIDNYKEVLKGELRTQWEQVFLNNMEVILYVIVFYVPKETDDAEFATDLTISATGLEYEPLTKAFDLLYSISYFKSLFSTSYDGQAVTGADFWKNDSHYFDLSLCLAALCKDKEDLSFMFSHVYVDLEEESNNLVKIYEQSFQDETAAATEFSTSTAEQRTENYWGYLYLMEATNTIVTMHSQKGINVPAFVLAQYFVSRNESSLYVGNALQKKRLSYTKLKPTGVPSVLNTAANVNIPISKMLMLDEKSVSYLMSIADDSLNDCILNRARNVVGFPVSALQIAKYIDYKTSMDLAKIVTAAEGKDVLKNEETYGMVADILLTNIQMFARIGRIDEINLKFPSYSELPESKTDIVVNQAWLATYQDDLEKVQIGGVIKA